MSTLHAKIVNQGPFTKAEANVLCLMCEGCFSKEIAARLCRSPRTVDKHRENIARKLDAHSTSEIVLIASKMGWVDIRIALSDLFFIFITAVQPT
jgi:DNA-binding NarL/FixJ family response regulator